MQIEIRSRDGTRLASAETLSGLIDQLVDICERQNKIHRERNAREDAFATEPVDISAISPEHVEVFRAGWMLCRRRFIETFGVGSAPSDEKIGTVELRSALEAFMRTNTFIPTIKECRRLTGWSLVQSKNYVEKLRAESGP